MLARGEVTDTHQFPWFPHPFSHVPQLPPGSPPAPRPWAALRPLSWGLWTGCDAVAALSPPGCSSPAWPGPTSLGQRSPHGAGGTRGKHGSSPVSLLKILFWGSSCSGEAWRGGMDGWLQTKTSSWGSKYWQKEVSTKSSSFLWRIFDLNWF